MAHLIDLTAADGFKFPAYEARPSGLPKGAVEALPAPGVLQDIQATIDHASQAGKVGLVGYCWGGLLTWRAACALSGQRALAFFATHLG